MEDLKNTKNEGVALLESRDQDVANKLSFLGINFDYSINNEGKLVHYLSEKFPDADNIILSCCKPDKAQTLLADIDDKIIFIGTGPNTYSTWYDGNENKLSSIKNS